VGADGTWRRERVVEWEAGGNSGCERASNWRWIWAGLGGEREEAGQRWTRRSSTGSETGNEKHSRDAMEIAWNSLSLAGRTVRYYTKALSARGGAPTRCVSQHRRHTTADAISTPYFCALLFNYSIEPAMALELQYMNMKETGRVCDRQIDL
jgi:hypothetical protein